MQFALLGAFDVWILGGFLVFVGSIKSDDLSAFALQQQEDEEMLVPHSDLTENNHQPMEGIYFSVFLLIRVEIPIVVLDRI